ncbi:MAG: four helix bundle protein [Candidatus Peribacteria bacterium]|nr:MAG: four helix bundle protein [Candidatus Peribacteria bacterium]
MYKCDYTKLLVWSESLNLAKIMYQITSTSLFARDVGLKEQLRSSAVSIPSNIAE